MDIEEHSWSDEDIIKADSRLIGWLALELIESEQLGEIHISKVDAVAIAKHFELTAEDLV